MKRYRLECPECFGRQVSWHGNVLVDCRTCDGKGWVPLRRLLAEGFVGFAAMTLAILSIVLMGPS